MTRNARALLILAAGLLVIAWLGSTPAQAQQQWGPYPARIVEIGDGDTFTAMINTFPGEYSLRDVRLTDINAPEKRGQCDAERALAARATARLVELTGGVGATIAVVVEDVDNFGRVIARALADGRDVGQVLLDEGLAREYADGQWRDGYWCVEINSKQKE